MVESGVREEDCSHCRAGKEAVAGLDVDGWNLGLPLMHFL